MLMELRNLWKVLLVLETVLLAEVYAALSGPMLTVSGRGESASVDPKVACALSLTRFQLADSSQITVLGHAPWLSSFLEATNVPVTLLQHRQGDKGVLIHNLISDVVFLVINGAGNRSFVEEAVLYLRKHHVLNLRVVVWWQTGDAQEAVEAVWELEMVRLIVISGSTGVQQVFGYREGCEHGSVVAQAVHLGECGEAGLFLTNPDVFLDLNRWNFYGCPVPLEVTHAPPFRVIRERPEGGLSLGGIWAPLAFAFAQRVNATLEVRNLSLAKQFGGLWNTDAPQKYDRREATYALTVRTETTDELADLSPSYIMVPSVWFVPSGLGLGPGSFNPIYHEFSPAVWAATGMAYVTIIKVLSLLTPGEHPVQDAAFFALAGLLGNSFADHPPTTRVRILKAFWLIFCIVLSTAYQAVLHSLVAAPRQPPEINSVQELLESGIPLAGSRGTVRDLKLVAEDQGDAVLLALSERAQVVTNLKEAVHRMAIKRDIALLFEPTIVDYHVEILEKASGRKLVHTIPGYRGSAMPLSNFVLRRGSRLSRAVQDVMIRVYDMGLIDKFLAQGTFLRPEPRQEWFQLTLTQLSAAFKVLLIGHGISALIFTTENISAYIVNSKV